MHKPPDSQESVNEAWRALFTGEGAESFHRVRRVFKLLPSSPRCMMCHSPFGGAGGLVMRVMGRSPARMNPNICDMCERFARAHPGGAEIPLSLLFADIRGST